MIIVWHGLIIDLALTRYKGDAFLLNGTIKLKKANVMVDSKNNF
jgi:hypothetical protein